MADPKRYWRLVAILTVVFCILAALGYWVAPGVRAGTVPAIGGLVWHGLGAIQLLITDVYGPIARRAGESTAPWLETAVLLALVGGSVLLLSMVIALPFDLIRRHSARPASSPDVPSSSE